ncbi:MAG: ABC transporter permease [Terracidiphilus sp.]|nr:ABC transporter permease [Terracidiphilus sp.]
MSWLRFFRRSRKDAELQEEIGSYLEEEAAENMARGMSADEARRQARIKLGNPQRVRETLWQQNTVSFVESAWRDLKYSARTLMRTPGFTATAILVMALGIGAAVALFTVVRSVLLKPLPFPAPNQLVALYAKADTGKGGSVAAADFYDWQSESRSFEQMAVWRWTGYNMAGDRDELPEFLQAVTCSWNLFSTLGVQPVLGRPFTSADDIDAANSSVILSWSFFKRRFNGVPSIIGKTIRLNGQPYAVVGVLPESFTYPDPKIQLWVPYHKGVSSPILHSHYSHTSHVIARLRPGVSLSQGTQEVSAIQHEIFARFNGGGPVSPAVVSLPLVDDVVGDSKAPLYILMVAVLCLLLIACLNLSNLLVARAVARRKEMAMRSALGGSRMRLIAQQITESVLICLSGGALGIVVAYAAVRWLTMYWLDLPRADAVHIDATVLAFAVGITFLAGIMSGVLPALLFTGAKVVAAMQDRARTLGASGAKASLRKGLLVVELALTVVLLVGAGLLFKSLLLLSSVDLGCTTRNVLTMRYFLRGESYAKPEQIVSFQTQILERVRHLPGVAAVGLTSVVPGDGFYGDTTFSILEHPSESPEKRDSALFRTADPGYFQAMQIPLVAGRFFTSSERLSNSNFIIINQKLAREYFPNEDPLGKHLTVSWISPTPKNFEIVGVVGDTRYRLNEPALSMMWFPILSGIPGTTTDTALVVRTATDPVALGIPIQKTIAGIDPDLPVSNILTMQQIIGKSTANSGFEASLLGAFATLSLLLAAVGLFGVLSYLVAQRTQEIGVRMALGAQRGRVLGQVLADGLKPAFAGLALGLVGSVAAVRLVRSMLYETRPLDPAVFLLVSAVLVVVAGAACMVPAWRASRLDPMQALRTE